MYLGHNIPLPHPSCTLSYDTQPVMHHASAFQHRAGCLAELVQPMKNVFVQVCCTLPSPLLGIIMDRLKVFEEKQSFKQEIGLVLSHEMKTLMAPDNKVYFLEVPTFEINWLIQ